MNKSLTIGLLVSTILGGSSAYAQATDVSVNIVGPVSARPGGIADFTIIVTNNGPNNATNVTLTKPTVSNLSINSVSCQAGSGTGASAACPGTSTPAALASGIVIPNLPEGSCIRFTVAATAGSSGSYTNVATISYAQDNNSGNNSSSVTTQIFALPCATTTYKIDVAGSAAANTIGVDGGTVNLLYTLSSGVAIPGIGNSFTVPVSYSDFLNQYGTDNRWQAVIQGSSASLGRTGVMLVPRTDGTGSLYNGLPANNTSSEGLVTPNGTDNVFTTKIGDGNLNPLGKFTVNIGNFPAPPSGVSLVAQQYTSWTTGNLSFDGTSNSSGWWCKPLANPLVQSTPGVSSILPVDMQPGQNYTFRYAAFGDAGATNSGVSRGVVIGDNDNFVTYGYNDAPVISSVTPATQTVATNAAQGTITATASKWNTNSAPTYQWYRNTTNANTGGTFIPGATAASYTPPASATTGTTYYYVVVSGAGTCSTTSGTVRVIVSNTPLAVQLLSFKAQKADKTSLLEWQTASEQNNRGFDIERSTDGKSWKSIDFVNSLAPSGNSNLKLSYSFTDPAPFLQGKNFYRLKQTDYDKQTDYSNVSMVHFDEASTVLIYPNPAKEVLYISDLSGNETIRVFDMNGRKVAEQEATGASLDLSLSALSEGVYTLTISNEHSGSSVSKKFIKTK